MLFSGVFTVLPGEYWCSDLKMATESFFHIFRKLTVHSHPVLRFSCITFDISSIGSSLIWSKVILDLMQCHFWWSVVYLDIISVLNYCCTGIPSVINNERQYGWHVRPRLYLQKVQKSWGSKRKIKWLSAWKRWFMKAVKWLGQTNDVRHSLDSQNVDGFQRTTYSKTWNICQWVHSKERLIFW